MRSEPIIANPLGWVQVQLQGGAKRIAAITGVYAIAVVVFHIFVYRMLRLERMSLVTFCNGAFTVMCVLMAIILIPLGVAAIKKAVQRDFTSDMIATHRTSAMTGSTAVIGYLTGSTATVISLTVVNWLACTVLSVLAGLQIYYATAWLVLLLCATSLIWAGAVLLALSTRGSTSIIGLVVLVVILKNIGVMELAPGLSLLLGFSTYESLTAGGASALDSLATIVSMGAQVVTALAVFIAAARKFARDDVTAFNPPLAYAVLAILCLTSALAMRYFRSVPGPMSSPFSISDLSSQAIGTLAVTALFAMLPVANAARNEADWSRRRAKDPGFAKPRPRSFLLAPVLATVLAFGIYAAVMMPVAKQLLMPPGATQVISVDPPIAVTHLDAKYALPQLAWIVGFFLLPLITVAGLLRLTYAYSSRGLWVLIGFIILTWALPPFADLALEVVRDPGADDARSILFACSPVGAWIALLKGIDVWLLPGLLVNASLAAGSLLLARRARY